MCNVCVLYGFAPKPSAAACAATIRDARCAEPKRRSHNIQIHTFTQSVATASKPNRTHANEQQQHNAPNTEHSSSQPIEPSISILNETATPTKLYQIGTTATALCARVLKNVSCIIIMPGRIRLSVFIYCVVRVRISYIYIRIIMPVACVPLDSRVSSSPYCSNR